MITTQEWQALDTYKKYNAIEDETGNRVRLTREKNGDSSNGFIYAKGKQRRGWRYSEEYVKLRNKDWIENYAEHKKDINNK